MAVSTQISNKILEKIILHWFTNYANTVCIGTG